MIFRSNAEQLFASDSECEAVQPKLKKPSSKRMRAASTERCAPTASTSGGKTSESRAPRKSKTTVIKSISDVMKPSMSDLFGSDSDGDDSTARPEPKKGTSIYSYITRRLANGTSRQTNETKTGSHYIELKVYSCDEIQNIQPMNRWRHSVVTIKNRTDTGTEAWSHLTDFIAATRKEFKQCPPTFTSNYY